MYAQINAFVYEDTRIEAGPIEGSQRQAVRIDDVTLFLLPADLERLCGVLNARLNEISNANEADWLAQNAAAVAVGA